MKKLMTFALVLAVMLTALAAAASVAAQEDPVMGPAEVVQSIYAAVSAGDVDAAVDLLAEDAVLTLIPPPEGFDGTFIGKEEIGGWYANLTEDDIQAEFKDISVVGNTVSSRHLNHGKFFTELGIAPGEMDSVAIVQDGLAKSLTFVFTPEFSAKMAAAMQRQADKAVVERYFDELWNQGNLDVIDEIIAEDFVSHTFPQGEGRAGMQEMVTGFRDKFPGVVITVDQIVFDGNRAFVVSHIVGPDGAPEAPGQDVEPEDVLVFDLRDGQITDRWYFAPPE